MLIRTVRSRAGQPAKFDPAPLYPYYGSKLLP
jgi:hypothetical protein